MSTKAQMYAQMADSVAGRLTSSWQDWAFLTTSPRLYKYPYHEQLMIYAQRPETTACAEYDLWNDKMWRHIRRGSQGIALVDDSGDAPCLRYVFDIADTGTRPNANVACRDAIDTAIAEHYWNNCLGNSAVQQVVDAFGYNRTLYVLANMVRQKDWDDASLMTIRRGQRPFLYMRIKTIGAATAAVSLWWTGRTPA